jgi:hypothetical protein
MTTISVQKLIDELNKVEDKSIPVLIQISNKDKLRLVKPAMNAFPTEVCVRDAKNWFGDINKSKALKII